LAQATTGVGGCWLHQVELVVADGHLFELAVVVVVAWSSPVHPIVGNSWFDRIISNRQ
jgi:pheromone shutdown protein TraB